MENQAITFEMVYTTAKINYVKNIIRKMVFDSSVIEDLSSEVFIKVYKHIKVYNKDLSSVDTWLYNITKNLVIDYMRKEKNRHVVSVDNNEFGNNNSNILNKTNLIPDNSFASTPVENKEMSKTIETAFLRLKGNYKTVAIMNLINNKSYNEIAEILDMPLGTVKVTIMRAKEMLQTSLKTTYQAL